MIIAEWTHDKVRHRLVKTDNGHGWCNYIMERAEKDAAGGTRWMHIKFDNQYDRPTSNEAALIAGICDLAAKASAVAASMSYANGERMG